jgi:hypothetical protein
MALNDEAVEKMVNTIAERFTSKRQLELLAYASICFKHGTSPFEMIHLQKKNVTADECMWLSEQISYILNERIDYLACTAALEGKVKGLGRDFRKQAEQDFQETQE